MLVMSITFFDQSKIDQYCTVSVDDSLIRAKPFSEAC